MTLGPLHSVRLWLALAFAANVLLAGFLPALVFGPRGEPGLVDCLAHEGMLFAVLVAYGVLHRPTRPRPWLTFGMLAFWVADFIAYYDVLYAFIGDHLLGIPALLSAPIKLGGAYALWRSFLDELRRPAQPELGRDRAGYALAALAVATMIHGHVVAERRPWGRSYANPLEPHHLEPYHRDE